MREELVQTLVVRREKGSEARCCIPVQRRMAPRVARMPIPEWNGRETDMLEHPFHDSLHELWIGEIIQGHQEELFRWNRPQPGLELKSVQTSSQERMTAMPELPDADQ